MKPQGEHAVLPKLTHDEAARASSITSMRKFFTTELIPGTRKFYETRLVPEFEKANGRAPSTAQEVKKLISETYYYRASSLIGRATQELLWDTVGEAVERQLPELIERAKPKPGDRGTLTIDPNFKVPDYIEAVDIHLMPGNFHTEIADDDVFAGALYDKGAYVFSYGSRGTFQEKLGVAAVNVLNKKFPNLKPKRILEMGCGTGASTLPLKDAYPDAEVYAIDVGAPMVRYAHGRAESLGRAIHFSQQDAQHTNFPDGYFDLVVSIIMNHELPLGANKAVLKETYRLLVKGGIALHEGTLSTRDNNPDPYAKFMSKWFAVNINEPFGQGVDINRDYAAAGFNSEDILIEVDEADEYLKGQLPPHLYVGAVKR